jgi:3-phenylpropionate/trans-cinnamate dioxygenase ferredoxin reductase subunit
VADRRADVLLIGGGVASAACAAELREQGFTGSILLVGREPDGPYDRPPCSKSYLAGATSREDAMFHPPGLEDVEVLTRTSLMRLDAGGKVAKLSSREEIAFGRALIATGANVRRLNVDGADLEGIHYLRAFGNADAIRGDAEGASRAVVVGGSYLGCEVAATLTSLGVRCTVVMQEEVTLERGFGPTAGAWFQSVLEARGVEVVGGVSLARFEGEGRVARVVADSGDGWDADLVVMATGAVPDVMTARGAKLALGETGGVRCDRTLLTSAPEVWAAGDMCEWDSVLHGGPARVEHWAVAIEQGKAAARNMLGAGEAYREVPYFFSDLADWASLEYVGVGGPAGAEDIQGSMEDGAWSLTWRDGDRVLGCLSVGRRKDLKAARAAISEQA